MERKLIQLLATFFYAGYLPLAPGSMASLAGAGICILLRSSFNLYLLLFVIISAIGFAVSGKMEKMQNDKDPSCVVIDEVAGSFIAFFMLPATWPVFITAYFLFRAFDMFKIFPANKFESFGGSLGIMSDDLVAGLYTNLIMNMALWIIKIF